MRSGDAIGVVAGGSAGRSYLSRLPAALKQLGPVKADSFPLARRIVNSLRAGYAVSHYSALEVSPLILILVPETRLPGVLRDLASQMPIHRTAIVVCESSRDSHELELPRKASAKVATINLVPETREMLFAGEGHPDALRAVRRLLTPDKRLLTELKPGGKALYFAALHLTSQILLPCIDSGVECLRAAGFSRGDAARVGEASLRRMARSYARAGRKAWSRRTAAAMWHSFKHDVDALEAVDPRWAALYAEAVHRALAYFTGESRESPT